MKKAVYLIGAGAIQGEMAHEGIESDITMSGISEMFSKCQNVVKENITNYWKNLEYQRIKMSS